MNINHLQKNLKAEINHLLKKYEDRIKWQLKKLNNKEILGLIGGCASSGAIIGTAIPGVGNAVGGAAGLVVGGIVAASLVIDYQRKNKKFHNAQSVLSLVNPANSGCQSRDDFVDVVAKKIINEGLLKANFNDADKSVIKNIARHSIAGVKAYSRELPNNVNKNDLINAALDGVRECKSKKAGRNKVAWDNQLFFSPKKIERDKFLAQDLKPEKVDDDKIDSEESRISI